MAIFRHVLVATDFSAASRPALELAREVARDAGAPLTIAHVCEVPLYADIQAPVDLVTPVADLAQAKLDELVGSFGGGPRVRGVLKIGVPWEQILAAAAEAGADLVVVGTHGRRGVAHAILGSVAERVVRLADVPVLTVRAAPGPAAER